MSEIRKKIFQGLDGNKSPEPRHSQLLNGEVEVEGSRERDNYRVPITGTEMGEGILFKPEIKTKEWRDNNIERICAEVRNENSHLLPKYAVEVKLMEGWAAKKNVDKTLEILDLKAKYKKAIELLDLHYNGCHESKIALRNRDTEKILN